MNLEDYKKKNYLSEGPFPGKPRDFIVIRKENNQEEKYYINTGMLMLKDPGASPKDSFDSQLDKIKLDLGATKIELYTKDENGQIIFVKEF